MDNTRILCHNNINEMTVQLREAEDRKE